VIGQTISHYRVIEKLGAGGMGVVYKAEDLKLGRHVALKFLPEELAKDPQALERFQQEARAASALNHPNICTIHEVDEVDGQPFIVMELLEGQTLAPGPMDVDKLLEVGVQISRGLEAAHAKGIVHRDLKPSNIFITKHAQAKILDFGVAKLVLKRPQIGEAASFSTTVTLAMRQHLTTAGVALGTVVYMSPEQLRGRELDLRTDIFSFGIVLYQMATGTLPFRGDSFVAVCEAILNSVPILPAYLNPAVPKELERIICKALEKDRESRYQCADDLRTDLSQLQHRLRAESTPTVVTRLRGPARPILRVSLLMLCLFLAIVVTFWPPWRAPTVKIVPPQVFPVTSYLGQPRAPAFSPDGNEIAFLWDGGTGGDPDVYVKLIGEPTSLRLTKLLGPKAGTVWSSDGRYVVFVRAGKDPGIFEVPALGGQERRLVSLQSPVSGLRPFARQFDWSPDGKLLAVADKLTPNGSRSIFLISVANGDQRRLTSPPETGEDFLPAFSPDGQTIAFGRAKHTFVENIYVVPVTGGIPRQLTFLENAFLGDSLAWTPDEREIVFSSVEGPSKASLWRVSVHGGAPERVLVGVGVQNAAEPVIARKGNRLAYTQISTNVNIWRIALPTVSRITRALKLIYSTRYQDGPQYSPDGTKIAFVSDRSGSNEIWVCNSDGSSPTQLTSFAAQDTGTPRWSSDGKQIVFDSLRTGNEGVYVVNSDGSGLRPLVVDAHTNNVPSWSRDGRWIYFASDRTGTYEVWKVPSEGGQLIQITKKGGFVPFESLDARWVYYTKGFYGAPGLWRVPVQGGEEVPVMEQFKADNWGAWAVAKRGIYFVDSDVWPLPTLKFFNFSTRHLNQVMSLEKLPALSGNPVLAVSPDEQAILYAQIDDIKSDIMLVENFR
jgi:Tol biopolymer transport system component